MKKWLCTDTYVGERAYFYKGKFVALSYQDARKSDEIFSWVTKKDFFKVSEYCYSLLGINNDDEDITILDLDTEYGESYSVYYASNILDKYVIYTETNELCEVIKTYNHYNTTDWTSIDIKLPNGEVINVKGEQIKVPYPIVKKNRVNLNIIEKTGRLILLPTDNKSPLCLNINGVLYFGSDVKLGRDITLLKNQYLYFTTNDITEAGDWFIHKNKWIHKCKYKIQEDLYDENDNMYFSFDCQKIVATMDKVILSDVTETANYVYSIESKSINRFTNFYNFKKLNTEDVSIQIRNTSKIVKLYNILK